jgi:hypothetical protein
LVSEVCSTALAELQNVAHLLREALSEHPSLAEAESGLLTATHLLATARRVEDELIPQPEFLPEFPPAAVLMAEFLPNPDLGGGAAPPA